MSMVERELKRQAADIDPHLPSTVSDLLYGRVPGQIQVFVSSKMSGGALRDERASAIEAIAQIEGACPWAWEISAPVGMYHSETIYVENARHSDMLVLILEDDLTVPTHKEYKAAKEGRAQCCVFTKAGATQSDKARKFVEYERKHAITGKFANTSELKTRITSAIWQHLVRAARTHQAHERILVARRGASRRRS